MKVALIGFDGFLGHALSLKLHQEYGKDFRVLEGDIRNPDTFADLDPSYDMLFHFAGPSSQVLFERNPGYCIDTTITGFMNVAKVCKANGIKLIYPSTGVLSQGATNLYSKSKQMCEEYHLGTKTDALALRIFATYGPGEAHKRDFASVPYLFTKDVVAGRSPLIFGDGRQTRDFIYIDDCVNAIYELAMNCSQPIVNVGSGNNVSFLNIIGMITGELKSNIKPNFVGKPKAYVEETKANVEVMLQYYKPKVTIAEGIKRLVKELK